MIADTVYVLESHPQIIYLYFENINYWMNVLLANNINPSSPKGGLYQPPPNGYRPGAQNRTAKG